MTQHIVMWSGGITSWAVAQLVVERHGKASTTLLFADTKAEDEDLYRFNREATAQLGMELTTVADGRDPWQVFEDARWLGNTRIAQCSHELKQVPCRRWLSANADPADTVLHIGIDWTESHRIPAVRSGYAHTSAGCERLKVEDKRVQLCRSLFTDEGRLSGPGCQNLLPEGRAWRVDFPLTRPPYQDKRYWMAEAQRSGLKPTRMYGLGFEHANCGGACVKGGQAQWARLLEVFPERFARAEAAEQKMRRLLGKDVSILRDRTGGDTKPLTLTVLREGIEASRSQQPTFDELDWGGCGCFTDVEAA